MKFKDRLQKWYRRSDPVDSFSSTLVAKPAQRLGESNSENYTPQAGDRVRSVVWNSAFWMDVKHVEKGVLFGYWDSGTPGTHIIIANDRWIKIEPPESLQTIIPLPEKWWHIYANHTVPVWGADATPAKNSIRGNQLAILHIWTDEEGVDHAEIKRVRE